MPPGALRGNGELDEANAGKLRVGEARGRDLVIGAQQRDLAVHAWIAVQVPRTRGKGSASDRSAQGIASMRPSMRTMSGRCAGS